MNNSSRYIFDSAKKMGLEPEYIANYGLILIKHNGRDIYLFNSISNLNSSVASYIAKNKHTTRLVLERNNLPSIPFILPETKEEVINFLRKYKKIMVKPTYGMNSVGIKVIEDESELIKLDLSESILEEFIQGIEYRILVLDENVIAVHHCIPNLRTNKTKRISIPGKDWDQEMMEIAIKTANAMDLKFVSVDFIKDNQENLHILEVNSAPGISSYYEPDEGDEADVAKLIIEASIKNIRQ